MKPGGGRSKGNSFERRVAKRIVTAFSHVGIDKTDCYRTPSSGGHRYAKKEDPGDLVISPRLRKHFPFHVECKHYRNVQLWPLWINMESNKYKKAWKLKSWIRQAEAAAYAGASKKKMYPMVVLKANGNSPIMCLFPSGILERVPRRRMQFNYDGALWYATTLADLLGAMKK